MNDRRRPQAPSESPSKATTASLPLETVCALDTLAKAVDGTFVVVVEHPGAKYRRRAYLTVASAERSAANARAKGHTVTVYLAELKPLWRLVGGEGR
jgi:hypothetical protein